MLDAMKLYDAILDNQDKPDQELIIALERAIAKQLPYNHSVENIRVACGINIEDRDTTELGTDFNKASEQIQALENIFTKRELVFMVAKMQRKMALMEKVIKTLPGLEGLDLD